MEKTVEAVSSAPASISDVVADSKTDLDDLQKRLQVLKLMQREYVRVEKDFHRQFYDLDMQYQEKRQAIYNERKAIVSGMGDKCKGEPTDFDVKGVPGFWLRALKNCLPNLVRDCDEEALKHLNDIKLNMMSKSEAADSVPELSFILEFEFSANPFFENSTLTKQYFLDCDASDEFNGFSIVKTIGCQIHWIGGMNITEKEANSFFAFFSPPDLNEHADELTPTQTNELQQVFDELQRDFEIGLMFKEKLIPNAILYYLDEVEEVIDFSALDDDKTTESVIETTEL